MIMADNERVGDVLDKTESLVKQLDQTVAELVKLLRDYTDHQEEIDEDA
jgi:hypothetical protein